LVIQEPELPKAVLTRQPSTSISLRPSPLTPHTNRLTDSYIDVLHRVYVCGLKSELLVQLALTTDI